MKCVGQGGSQEPGEVGGDQGPHRVQKGAPCVMAQLEDDQTYSQDDQQSIKERHSGFPSRETGSALMLNSSLEGGGEGAAKFVSWMMASTAQDAHPTLAGGRGESRSDEGCVASPSTDVFNPP